MTEKRCPPNIGEHLNYLISILPRLLIPYYSEASASPQRPSWPFHVVGSERYRDYQKIKKIPPLTRFDYLKYLDMP